MMDHNQLRIRTYMAIMAERDAAVREWNMDLEERKKAFAERNTAMLQRDAAIAECNSAIQERDEAVSALSLQESSPGEKMKTLDTATQGNHNDIQQQMDQIIDAAAYGPRGNLTSEDDSFNFREVTSGTTKPRNASQQKESKRTKSAKFRMAGERGTKGSRRPVLPATSSCWANCHDVDNDDEDTKPDMSKDSVVVNVMKFDDSVMPAPVCTCTGLPQPCYRWGSGGWQSACCTTTISMYPLPQVSNKRYARVGGRKMSGSAFNKLLNRLASEGHDPSTPLDLKNHWAKHGTNRHTIVK